MFTNMKISKIKKLAEHKHYEGILPYCENEDPQVRVAAAEGLAEIGTDESNNALIGMLRDHDITVKTAAVKALGKIKENHSYAFISHEMEQSKDETFIASCRQALSAIHEGGHE